MLFSSPSKATFWPKPDRLDIFVNRKSNYLITLDLSLWEKKTQKDLETLANLFKDLKPKSIDVIVPDDAVFCRSFIYEDSPETVSQKFVADLSRPLCPFDVVPDYVDFNLISQDGKLLIKTVIYDQKTIDILKSNFSQISQLPLNLIPLSQACINSFSLSTSGQYFLLYPLNKQSSLLVLANNNVVYLSQVLKSSKIDIQKNVNFSKQYFGQSVNRLFMPENFPHRVSSQNNLAVSTFNEGDLSARAGKTSDIPLPVLATFLKPSDIIKPTTNNLSPPKMEPKRNVLPIVAVFIFTAALASIIIWFVLNRNSAANLETPGGEENLTPTEVVEISPTETPVPTLADISKDLKLQVLNATDINGQAATLKEIILKLGFKSIAVGNSPEKATSNTIRVKTGMTEKYGRYFESSLSPKFDATVEETLKSSSPYDVVFVIGVDLSSASSEKAIPSPKSTPTSAETTTDE